MPAALCSALILIILFVGLEPELSSPLQQASAQMATALLRLLDAPSQLDGTTITTGDTFNRVTAACSGLEVMTAIALLTFTIGGLLHVGYRRLLPTAAAMVGVAFMMNAARIASISYLAWTAGVEMAWGGWHDLSGYVAFGLCYGCMVAALFLLRPRRQPPEPSRK